MDLSLVFPCYCEEPHLERNVLAVMAELERQELEAEIVLVDDCSPDGTRRVIQSLTRRFPQEKLRAIYHAHNQGRGGAVMTGIRATTGRVVGFFDIDLEVSPAYVGACVKAIEEGADLAIGARSYRIWPAVHRHVMSRSYRKLASSILGIPTKLDSESGYKFFRRDVIAPMLGDFEHTGWFWDTEVVYRFLRDGYDVTPVPCRFVRDPAKKSTVKIARDSWEYFKTLTRFALRYGRLDYAKVLRRRAAKAGSRAGAPSRGNIARV